MLYMMGRDDIAVGMGGEGGILPNGTILPDVGGYLPIIDQVTKILHLLYLWHNSKCLLLIHLHVCAFVREILQLDIVDIDKLYLLVLEDA